MVQGSSRKARKVLVKRILDSNQRLSTASSPHTPIAAVSRKHSGLTPEGAALVAAPKRLCLTENNDNSSPAVMVSL